MAAAVVVVVLMCVAAGAAFILIPPQQLRSSSSTSKTSVSQTTARTSAPTGGGSTTTTYSTTSLAPPTGNVMRVGLDLASYVRAGFGSQHGVNCNLAAYAASCYNYLTHGWKDSGGLTDGTCPSGTCSGGFFTAYSYDIEIPPGAVQGMAYTKDEAWLLGFIAAANADAGGQRAKIFVRFTLLNEFDSSIVGSIDDFLNRLGPAQDNPAVAGLGFRGAQEGINTGGGASSGGCEGANFVPAKVAYGPTGMNSFPQNTAQLTSMWDSIEATANSYGYSLGVSTGLSNMDQANCLGTKDYVDSLAQWFIQGSTVGVGVTASPSSSYTSTYNTFYSSVVSPPRAASVSVGQVFGEWTQTEFVPGWCPKPPLSCSGYGLTQYGLQAAMSGFAAGAAISQSRAQYWFTYGMPYLTNDDPTTAATYGPSPFIPWMLQYATEYGFFTDFSSAPSAPTPTYYYPAAPSLIGTGLYIHILGDASLDSQKPSYSQTDPVTCCGTDTYRLDGQLTSDATGQGIPGQTVHFYIFDFVHDRWAPLNSSSGIPLTAVTNANGWFGYSSNCPTCALIQVSSPPLPSTTREQAYFYDAFLGSGSYLPSYGVLEDLPVLPAG